MGLYDTIRGSGVGADAREGQVKCWGENFRFLTIGDKVENIGDEYSYVIAMREGGFVVVFKNHIIAWEDEIPEESKDWPLFDKWGSSLEKEALEKPVHGLGGHERYFFNE